MIDQNTPGQSEIQPITITTTITSTVYPDRPNDAMCEHAVKVETDAENVPKFLVYGVAQAACEASMIHLHEKGIGVLGYSLEDLDRDPDTLPVDNGRCPEGNLYRMHMNGPCAEACDLVEVVV